MNLPCELAPLGQLKLLVELYSLNNGPRLVMFRSLVKLAFLVELPCRNQDGEASSLIRATLRFHMARFEIPAHPLAIRASTLLASVQI